MTKKNFTYGLAFICVSIFVIGCSELKDEKIPTQAVASVHGVGFADPASSNFHSTYIQSKNYNIQQCQQCHGSNYAGGTSGKSCLTCHTKQGGPENCTLCHGSVNAAPPKDLSGNTNPTVRGVGAHQKHLLSSFGAAVACTECHNVPSRVTDPGHITNSLHAAVRFDSTSNIFRSNAAYDAANITCTNTYCHGNFKGGNQNRTMVWTDTSAAAVACGTCHGDATKATLAEKAFPVSGHPSIGLLKCYQCHGNVVDSTMAIINPSRHINGKID